MMMIFSSLFFVAVVVGVGLSFDFGENGGGGQEGALNGG